MKNSVVALFASALLFAAHSSGVAASPITDYFLANVGANEDFIDRSSRLAIDRSDVAAVRSFAHDEAREAAKFASAIGYTAPTAVTASAGVSEAAVVTGRSVAIDGAIQPQRAEDGTLQAANGRMPMGQADLDDLKGLTGQAFDDLYWRKQLDALSQIESDDRAYIAYGDDPSLVALARRDLPKVMRRLMALTKI